MREWLEPAVWQAVARELGEYQEAGLQRLLTEDVVRFSTARALVAQGCDPLAMRLEWPHPQLPGSRVDLVVGDPPEALVELKFPREPNEQNAAWTMALGEVLKDLYRLAVLPQGDRVFVYVETARLHRYMTGAADRYGLALDGDAVVLEPEAARALPQTAAQIVGPQLLGVRVTATRLQVLPVGDQLRLSVYLVDGAEPGRQGADPTLSPPAAARAPAAGAPAAEQRLPASAGQDGAREQIHDAVRAVCTRSGRHTFSVDEVLREMRSRGTRYADSTIRTMITSHLCANAPDHAAVTYDDFERVERGIYRPLWL